MHRTRKNSKWLIPSIILCVFAVLLSCGLVTLVNAGESSDTPSTGARVGEVAATAARSAAPSPTATAAGSRTPVASDMSLKVKITDRDCFGSAGCNVQYQIRASLAAEVNIRDECEVTYEVKGLQDTQVGTLTMRADGTYQQDEWQSGQTARSSAKLTAKITEVECE